MSYVELFEGPETEIHVKYAEILNVVFVTLMYGPGMPILYIIGVIHFFIYYCVERYSILYND